MGRERKRKGKKRKVKGLDGTRFVQGREREGNDESVCERASKQRATGRRDEAGIGKVTQSQSRPLWREGLFSRGRVRGIGIAITTAQEGSEGQAGAKERAITSKGPPREGREETKRRPKEMYRLHQISARAPSSHTVDGRERCDWPGGPMLPFTMGPILRDSWSPPVTGTFNYRTQP